MNARKRWQKLLDRDGGCVHCGELERVSPHHRLNRKMGGSKERDVPSNIIVICSRINDDMEKNAAVRRWAIEHGWKLTEGQKPAQTPFYAVLDGVWYVIDDEFNRIEWKGDADADHSSTTQL